MPREERQQQQQQHGDGGSSSNPTTTTTTTSPNRECALLSEPARCVARRRARLPAYATERECCAAAYGSACMRFPDRCYAVDPDWPGQCRAVDGASECAALYWAARDKALASGIVVGDDGGLASDEDDGGAIDGGAAAAANTTAPSFPPPVVDDDPRRRRRELGFSLTREACCRVNAFDRAYCAQTVECYEPDRRALPTRRCVVTESARCLERMAAGLAYSTRSECCASAFGPGRGCREFPDVCYRFDPREAPVRPFDACPRVEDASAGKCALLLEQDGLAAREAAKEAVRAAKEAARAKGGGGGGGGGGSSSAGPGGGGSVIGDDAPSPLSPLPQPLSAPRVFEQRVDCCAAAMPLGWVDYDSPDLARGCPYAPSSCWAPMKARARPRPGVPPGSFDVFCAPVTERPAAECARRVSAGTAWVTRDECCRRVGGCARLPPRRPRGQAGAAGDGGTNTVTIVRGPGFWGGGRGRGVGGGGGGGGSSSSSSSGSSGSSGGIIGERAVLVRRQRGQGATAAASPPARAKSPPPIGTPAAAARRPPLERALTARELATEPADAAPWTAGGGARDDRARQAAIAVAASAPSPTILPAQGFPAGRIPVVIEAPAYVASGRRRRRE